MAALDCEAQDVQLRAESVCRGCGKDKGQPSMLMCWGCFKYVDNPFKYYDGSLLEWLREVGGDTRGLDEGSAEVRDE